MCAYGCLFSCKQLRLRGKEGWYPYSQNNEWRNRMFGAYCTRWRDKSIVYATLSGRAAKFPSSQVVRGWCQSWNFSFRWKWDETIPRKTSWKQTNKKKIRLICYYKWHETEEDWPAKRITFLLSLFRLKTTVKCSWFKSFEERRNPWFGPKHMFIRVSEWQN